MRRKDLYYTFLCDTFTEIFCSLFVTSNFVAHHSVTPLLPACLKKKLGNSLNSILSKGTSIFIDPFAALDEISLSGASACSVLLCNEHGRDPFWSLIEAFRCADMKAWTSKVLIYAALLNSPSYAVDFHTPAFAFRVPVRDFALWERRERRWSLVFRLERLFLGGSEIECIWVCFFSFNLERQILSSFSVSSSLKIIFSRLLWRRWPNQAQLFSFFWGPTFAFLVLSRPAWTNASPFLGGRRKRNQTHFV